MRGEEMSAEDMEALAREIGERALDERIVAALEQAPDMSGSIRADFAERVAARVPARRPIAVRETHYGGTMMWCSLAVLFVVLVIVAVQGAGRSVIGTAVEWSLCAQFLGIAIWLAMGRWRAN
jgi:cytochrome oxidase assembly protein ShyY1